MDITTLEALQRKAIEAALVNGQKVEYDLGQLIEKNKFDINRKPAEDSGILFLNNELVGSKGNIVSISGAAKSRKTVIASSIASAALCGREVLGARCDVMPDDTILHIDTEQGYKEYYNGVIRILQNAGLDYVPDNFVSIHERAFDTPQRLKSLDLLFEKYSPKLVIIDGIRDMLMDFNSNEETAKVISAIMRLSFEYDALIVCVIHVTKSNGNMRGALGTALEDKSETAIKVEKDAETPNRSHVKGLYCRHKDFEPYAICWDDMLNGYVLEEGAMAQVGRPKNELTASEASIRAIIQAPMKYGRLVESAMAVLAVGENRAKAFIRQAVQDGYIIKDQDTGLYTSPYLAV